MSLAAYLPIDRYHALAQASALPDYTTGAALFADISGFTSLTETLAHELGPRRGGEELSQHLNTIYDLLIGRVHRYHGSVIGFSGDAITCWFEGSEVEATHRAVTVALAMQNAIGQIARVVTSHGQEFKFALKVAVASGSVRRFVVGDPQYQYLDLLAGSTLDRMAQAEQLAHRGEVVLDPVAAEILQAYLQPVEWRNLEGYNRPFVVVGGLVEEAEAWPWPDLPPVEDARLQPWLLDIIYQRLEAGMADYLTELRPAAALFVGFKGLDYDNDPQAGAKLDAYIRWVQSVVKRYEGTLLQVTIGDKGSYLYSAFGAPIAYQNSVERAVRAGQLMLKPPPELDWLRELKIGLSQGMMRTGAYGSTSRHTYGVLGDEVNLAARLMQAAAPGQMLVSERASKAAGNVFSWESLPPLRVKGKTEPVIVFRVAEGLSVPRPEVIETAPIIGRRAELSLFAQHLGLVKAGTSSAVIVEGEPGIGKSRLVAEFMKHSRAAGVADLLGAGDAIEQSKPYHAWGSIFSQLLELEANPEIEARQSYVLSQVRQADPQLLDLAPLLNQIVDLRLPENSLTAQMTGQVRADNTTELVVALLQTASSRNPTLLVLEDAQWLDSASWALALAVSRQVRSLLLALVIRPFGEQAPAEYRRIVEQPGNRQIWLDTLPPDEMVALICQRLKVTALPALVSKIILEKAEGNPFFSEELAYAMRDAGQLIIQAGECRVADDLENPESSLNLPDTVQEVITSRIDRLAPAQQLTLKAASVVGRVFNFQTLQGIYPLEQDRSHLPEYLSSLEKLDITLLETPLPDLAYYFRHLITQEVAYNLMLFAQRRQLHQAVAEWYEQHHSQDLALFYSLLAYHWGKAEVTARTLEYLNKSGEQALRTGAYQESLHAFTEILRLVQAEAITVSALKRAGWEFNLGKAYHGLGRLSEARPHLEEAVKLAGFPIPSSKGRLALRLLSQLGIQALYRQKWYKLRPAPEDKKEAMTLAAQALVNLTEIYLFTNEPLPGISSGLLRANLAEQVGSPGLLVEAYTAMCLISSALGLTGLAEKYIKMAQEQGERLNDLALRGFLGQMVSVYRAGLGQYAEAKKAAEQSVYYYRQLGDKRQLAIGSSVVAFMLYCQGRFAESDEMYIRLYQTARRNADIQMQNWSFFARLRNLLPLGRMDEIQALLASNPDLLAQPLTAIDELTAKGALIGVYLQQGDYQAARQKADEVLAATGKTPGRTFGFLIAYCAPLEAYLQLWEKDPSQRPELEKLVIQAARKLRSYGWFFPVGKLYSLLYQGQYRWLAGQPEKASKAWQAGLAIARKLDLAYEQALLHYQIGRHLPESDRHRRQHLDQASQLFTQLGAAWNLQQVQLITEPPAVTKNLIGTTQA